MEIVAPLAGAWIEINLTDAKLDIHTVAPLAGAWIEMFDTKMFALVGTSLPSRERGLKFSYLICAWYNN